MATYSDDDRAHAVDRYRLVGPHAASRETGIPRRSIERWAKAAGVKTEVVTAVAAANAARAVHHTHRIQTIIERIADEIEHTLDLLHSPTTERRLIQASGTLEYDIVNIDRPGPTVAERKAHAVTLGILVDKYQLLTGGVTERIGVQTDAEVEEEAERVLRLVRGTG